MSFNFCDKKLIKLYIVFILVLAAFILSIFFEYVKEALLIVAWIVAGFSVFQKCFENFQSKIVLDENFLMTVATLGAIILGNYTEAVCVMVLYQIGEYFQDREVDKSKKSITELINIRPLYANVERNGKVEKIEPQGVMIGETIIIKPGERIPLDGVITAGQSSIDVSSLTGESVPRTAGIGTYIYSGCINLSGVLKVRVEKFYSECTVNKIMKLIEEAKYNKSSAEKLITRFAKIYTPCVVIFALILIIIPCILNGLSDIRMYVERALTFLVISCPCAFVISVPLTFFAGIGAASKYGVLIKGENHLESLAYVNTAVFDKTGTLTKGKPKVSKVVLAPDTLEEELAEAMLTVESGSNHPVAVAIKNAFNYGNSNGTRVNRYNITELPGKGMWATFDGREIFVGNKELMDECGVSIIENEFTGMKIFAAKDKKYLGCVVLNDEVKQSARTVVSKLKDMGIKSLMLTGDINENASLLAKSVGIDEWYASLMPEDKVYKMEKLVTENKKGSKVLYVGDGINDAAVLSRSDVGMAMGMIGSAASIEASDIVITDDNLMKIVVAVNIAKKTVKTAKENIMIAIGVKMLFLSLASVGLMTMWLAIFADTGVTLLAIFNALEILGIKNKKIK